MIGQSHQFLGNVFDFISPMVYQRMIKKPIGYIHEFTQYLFDLTGKHVVPAIAVKDMPDNLPDGIDAPVLRQEYNQATRLPSTGVCWFSWDGAIEKHKIDIIKRLWAS